MPEDENPFENVPDEFAEPEAEPEKRPEPMTRRYSTIEETYRDLPPLPPGVAGRSRFAMASGFGFVVLAVLIYLGIVIPGGFYTYLFGLAGMMLAVLVPLFYMLDDLRIRPRRMTERGVRFIAGILLAVLFLVVFSMVTLLWADYFRIVMLSAIIVLTDTSFSLFFYSMLWEE